MNRHANPRPGFDRRMTREEINGCPVASSQGPVDIIRTPEERAAAVRRLKQESVLGLDTETRPAFTKGRKFPPALLQLAGRDRVFLFQLRNCGLSGSLLELLSDEKIIKAGVSLDFDLRELRQLHEFQPAGFIELGTMARRRGIKNQGLRGLAAVLLGIRITKSARTSNWARRELTAQQIRYAATDAWVGREIYFRLLTLDPLPDSGR